MMLLTMHGKIVLPQLAPLLLSTILASRAIPTTADKSLHAALAPVGLEDSAAMAGALQTQGLSSLLEVQLLHVEEAQEMWSSLRETGISLGDRAKLRRAARGQSDQRVHNTAESMNTYTHPQADSSVTPIGMTSPPRRLQEGVSSDSIALMATAALGILSFIIQGRVAAREAKNRADLDRAHAARAANSRDPRGPAGPLGPLHPVEDPSDPRQIGQMP
jgi:hypothetical protein